MGFYPRTCAAGDWFGDVSGLIQFISIAVAGGIDRGRPADHLLCDPRSKINTKKVFR